MTTAILFACHKADEITKRHHNLLVKHNPDCDVIPITDGDGAYGVDLCHVLCPLQTKDVERPYWYYCDRLLWKAFHTLPAYDRYVWIEWDTYCSMPLQEAYGETWDKPLVGRDLYKPPVAWYWWKDVRYLDSNSQIAGLSPLQGFLASYDALQTVLSTMPMGPAFCELRIGTAINRSGIPFTPFPATLRDTIRWHMYKGLLNRGVYHSVKA